MPEHSDSVGGNRQVLPWLVVALTIVLAGVGFVWMNSRIEALQAATVARQDSGVEQTKRTVAALEQTVKGIQSSQQNLVDRIADIRRKIASDGGERKLMSDQLGALSSRVDALASANADSAGNTQSGRQNPHSRR